MLELCFFFNFQCWNMPLLVQISFMSLLAAKIFNVKDRTYSIIFAQEFLSKYNEKKCHNRKVQQHKATQ